MITIITNYLLKDTTLSTYDVEAKISYRANGVIPDYCADVYAQSVEQFQENIGTTLSQKCTEGAGSVDIQVIIFYAKLYLEIVMQNASCFFRWCSSQPRLSELAIAQWISSTP